MQSNYPSPVLDFTLRYEGGWSDDPRDPGGATMKGVTQGRYDIFRTGNGLPKRSVRLITDDELHAIYRNGYWATVKGDDLPDGLDLAAFDLGVNSGPARALSYLRGISLGDPAAAVHALCAKRLSFLHALKTWQAFGKGWAARVAACEALGVKMALQGRYGAKTTVPANSGIAKQLQTKAAQAAGKAKAQTVAASTSGLGGGAAAATVPDASTGHLPLSVIMVVLAVAATVAGYFAWRAFIHRQRVAAFLDAAKG